MPEKPEISGVVSDLTTSLRNLTASGPVIAPAAYEPVQALTRPHIDSFNFAIGDGLRYAIEDIPWQRVKLKDGRIVGLKIREASVNKPDNTNARTVNSQLRPTECRQRKITYAGALKLKLRWSLNGEEMGDFERPGGEIPIMVKSSKCHLHGLTPKQLIKCGEEENEFGGYFIINGNEKLLRLLIAQRANYAMAIKRSSWAKKEKDFTEFGVTVRCVKRDGTANTNVLHYLSTGTCTLSFVLDREPFYVPVMLVIRALTNWSDKEIFEEIAKGQEDNVFLKGCVMSMMRQLLAEKKDKLYSQKGAQKFLGQEFRSKFRDADFYTDEEICEILLKRCVAIHLETNEERVRFLCFMVRKLYVFVRGGCAVENPDSPMNQDILTSGNTYLVVLKERLEILVRNALFAIQKAMDRPGTKTKALTTQYVSEEFSRGGLVTRPMQYFLATGNLNPKTLVNLQQTSGFAVVADKINYMRYIAHFRSVHRGAFFQEMRTTACRKLLPEAWGFMCPVHTPDGAPCGLLNHLAAACRVARGCPVPPKFLDLLRSLGMIDPDAVPMGLFMEYHVVMVDGKMVGWLPDHSAAEVVDYLRVLKTSGSIPEDTELAFVPKSDYAGQFPGLYVFLSSMGRFSRPVINLRTNTVEWIGSFEQVYLNICIKKEEAYPDLTTHMELTEQVFLSEVAAMIPFSDHNQSPRNLYQCQMGKQSMATPVLNWPARADNKLYRIQTPQSPLVRPKAHEYFKMDDHPMGTNAIVAVISFTGYDMEDAMIINKGSFERGFGYGSIYKSEFIDLREKSKSSKATYVFGVVSSDAKLRNLGPDGLPYVGTRIEPGDVLCCYYDKISQRQKIETWDELEMGIVDSVRCLGSESGSEVYNHVCITMRIPRPPTVGDKFASRHGQKGVCSKLYPVEDMPFTESGMIPDIIFNPHGYPSRMTIGMMIETMAGKVAALDGVSFDATPFVYGEDNTAIERFGQMLQTAGFNFYGNERMYSGVDGRELEVAIFFGVVYYQRLRHMVSDKYQVRTTGAVDELTGQPIKGRKRGGGTRFGEMERDALIAHGASYLLHDRLFNNSDGTTSQVCKMCGSILSPIVIPREDPADASLPIQWMCKVCPNGGKVVTVRIPQVFRYLVAELASCNMKIMLKIEKSA
ncbi:DNA-directed RNA polymerase I subunit RPA2-like [Paramacrobiotus metropolitanus]|uniref:DNA-directed RNA polymerase I subunit RPA2-like n=1 Tax=Paramacrobiotus metropolitanus TaxID=2943436 RepID=UPI0024460FCA|nr:DNA-directed RNA polymerase I subunit RPA2-like [Paramacrobiotus metropolitanus]